MSNNIILSKLLVLFYMDYISYINETNIFVLIAFNLVYITILLSKLWIKRKYINILNVLEGLLTLSVGIMFVPIAILLLSILIMELFFFMFKKEILALIVPALVLVIPMDKEIIIPSITITMLNFIFMRNIFKNVVKFNILINTVEKQRKQINQIESKLKEEQSIREQFLYTTKLEELNKVTESLNQKIGQTISGALFQLDTIKVMINQDSEGSKVILGRAIKNLKDGMEEIKSILFKIKPTEGELGINRVKLILEENTKNSGMRFKVSFDGDLDSINQWQWNLLMDIINELSINSVKYSKGDFINIILSVLEQNIRLQVSDNGIGAINIIKGNGLNKLEEATKEVEGKVIFKDDNGFSVIILIPLREITV